MTEQHILSRENDKIKKILQLAWFNYYWRKLHSIIILAPLFGNDVLSKAELFMELLDDIHKRRQRYQEDVSQRFKIN